MIRPRVIPCLLLRAGGLVKTVKFGKPKYIGDPIVAVNIFNEKCADELIVLDIDATREMRGPCMETVREIASECFMPLTFGGGISSIADCDALFRAGVEKVAICSSAINLGFVAQAAERFGSQSIVVAVDVRRRWMGGPSAYTHGGTRKVPVHVFEYLRRLERAGAGEILLNAIHKDGTMAGPDLDLIGQCVRAVDIPVVACGGVGSFEDIRAAMNVSRAAAVAVGSYFVFQGKSRAVLINYPTDSEIQSLQKV